TYALGLTADYVPRELNTRGVPFWRTDLADFPTRSTLHGRTAPRRLAGQALDGHLPRPAPRDRSVRAAHGVVAQAHRLHVPGDDGPEQRFAYRDPGTEVGGLTELAAYMAGFAGAFPGHRFRIDEVVEHHDRSLARWTQLGEQDEPAMTGVSTALHRDGRLADITGFFLPA
ncbi:nuclear transport factor 2 family protein, partial [Streptomyces violascens]|uniref:nuclear transport factor 2 family protein n=1 Tax=Streptomyces violascens TaxID=67381 RepID=UPI00364F4D2C